MNPENANKKQCFYCGEDIKGRIDKKFCDDQCRNSYNNRLNSDASATVRNINNILRKNRRIIESLLPEEGKLKTNIQKLQTAGFNFTYHTHTYTTLKGSVYHFCYEYGYLKLDDNLVMLVKRIQNDA
jgi:hypothetical protein